MYLNLNPIVATKVVPFIMNSEENTSLYDFMKIDKKNGFVNGQGTIESQ
jgi:hypothetical protein